MSLRRGLFRAVSQGLFSAAGPWLRRRYAQGFPERTGRIEGPLSSSRRGKPLWVHAVSVGEVQAAYPFVLAARRDGYNGPLVLSTITETGRSMALRLLGDQLDRVLRYPWDAPSYVRRALDALDPWSYVTFETELWPVLLWELQDRGIPSFLANGRLSLRSWGRMTRTRRFWGDVLGALSACLVREEADAARFRDLGVSPDRLHVLGDCKVDALFQRRAASDPGEWRRLLGGAGPLLVAGSTHEGEEAAVCEAFSRVRRRVPGARLLWAPRHPQRAGACLERAREVGAACLFSQREADWTILVLDVVGVLFDLYGIADGAFVGGSLVPRGGQNLMEPAVWGVPILHGPHMEDFQSVAADLDREGLSREVRGTEDLEQGFLSVLEGGFFPHPGATERYFAPRIGAATRTWGVVKRLAGQDNGW